MRSVWTELTDAGGDPAIGLAPLAVGIVLVAVLITAFVYDRRRRGRRPPPPAAQPGSGSWSTPQRQHEPGRPDQRQDPEQRQDAEGHASRYENASREPETLEPPPGERARPGDIRDYPGPRT
jgi:Family of unknown function (DUF6479)